MSSGKGLGASGIWEVFLMLFDDVVREYMAAKAQKVRPNTFEGYESAIRCHLLPKWSGLWCSKLSMCRQLANL